MEEIWKDIENYEGLYQVSNLGRIKSFPRRYSRNKAPIIMKQRIDHKGYLQLSLCKNGKEQNKKVHRLVAQGFIPNPNNLPQINHIDGVKTNNNVSNLEWCDNSYNQLHANRMGLNKHRLERVKEVCNKPVAQLTLNDDLLNKYISLREASEKTGCNYKSMSACASGKTKSSGGYKWKYIDKIDLFVSNANSVKDTQIIVKE